VAAGKSTVAVHALHLNERVCAPKPVCCVFATRSSSVMLCSTIGFASTAISFSVPQYWHLREGVPGA